MAKIHKMRDYNGAQFYPEVHEKAVVDSNGVTLETKLDAIVNRSFKEAWDGDSTPVVAEIPAGVVVTYDSQSYTGTLAASAATAPFIYMVADGNGNYDRYVSELSGSSYVWKYYGNTEIDLSDYATKDDLSQLDQKTKNKVDKTTNISWIDGSYINYNNGDQITSTFASASSVVDISEIAGETMWYSRLRNTNASGYQGMAFYDASGQFISGIAPTYNAPEMGIMLDSTLVPANAKFARFSCPTTNKTSFELYYISLVKDKVSKILEEVEGIKSDIGNLSLYGDKTAIEITWISGEYYAADKAVKTNASYSRAVIALADIGNPNAIEVDLHSESANIWLYVEDAVHSTLWSLNIVSNTKYPLFIKIPAGGAYLLLSNKSANGVGIAYGFTKSTNITELYLASLVSKMPEYCLMGKKVSFLGDSMTYGSGATSASKRYSTLFCTRCGAIENNLGVQGSALATNAYNRQNSTRFAARATAENLAGSDLIIIFGGTNDFAYDSKAIGDLFVETSITPGGRIGSKELTAPSDTDTFAGALHELINLVRTNCPNTPIMLMTPINRGSYTSIAERPTSKQSNVNGNYLYEFVDAIKKIGAFYSIPVLDLSGSQLDFSDAAISAEFSYDNLHPNDKGYAIIAELLYRFVEQNIIITITD